MVNFISHGISKIAEQSEQEEVVSGDGSEVASGKEQQSLLAQFTTDLNAQARNGHIDPLVGRADEIERVSQILIRRRKNNPLLVGESGVGKTAIAEGLAKLIVDGKAPDAFWTALFILLIWDPYWRGPNIEVISKSVSRDWLKSLLKKKINSLY